jgi:hypothetical protein
MLSKWNSLIRFKRKFSIIEVSPLHFLLAICSTCQSYLRIASSFSFAVQKWLENSPLAPSGP